MTGIFEAVGFALFVVFLAASMTWLGKVALDAQFRYERHKADEWNKKHPIERPKYYIGRLK